MRKLCFRLVTNVPVNAAQPRNVSIITHTGSNLMIRANQTEVLDVTNDPMSDNELLGWYKSRYSGFGMGISILKDAPKAIPVVPVEEKSVEVVADETLKDAVENVSETVSVEELPQEKEESDQIVPTETVKVAKIEHKETPEEKVLKMSYQELLDFAKEHDLEVKPGRGRSEECVRKLCLEWLKAND